jgi:hypothetical protein
MPKNKPDGRGEASRDQAEAEVRLPDHSAAPPSRDAESEHPAIGAEAEPEADLTELDWGL